MKKNFIISIIIVSVLCGLISSIPSQAETKPSIPDALKACMPEKIEGKLRLQATTNVDHTNYYLYYVGSLVSDDGYDILIQEQRGNCQRFLDDDTKIVYPYHHYIGSEAAYQLYRNLYQSRIKKAGGLAQYQKQFDGENASVGTIYLSNEESRAIQSLGIKIFGSVETYPEAGWTRKAN